MPQHYTTNNLGGVLGQIVAERKADYAAHSPELGPVLPPQRRFWKAIAQPRLSLIAEIKCASPSRGPIAQLDPVQASQAYQRGGAAALSVLTEPRHFGGSPQALQSVASHCDLPILRKDFVVHPAMLREAAEWGASAVLLMVSVLGEAIGEYLQMTQHLGLDALVEVHDQAELALAQAAGAEIIGVNNRDLVSLQIDLETSPRLIATAQKSGYTGLLVAESGYHTATELDPIRQQANGVLVGSSLAGSGDLEEATRQLLTESA